MTEAVERMLPLYEAKMIHQFDHRWATYERDGTVRDVTLAEKQDPSFVALPRYWVREEVVRDRLGDRWDREWLFGWRDICRSTDERTMISSQFPTTAVGHTMPIALPSAAPALLQCLWSSFVFDYVARQKVGGTHMTYGYLTQLATAVPDTRPPWPGGETWWFTSRASFLQTPESWATAIRVDIRAELDGAWFHVFGVGRDDVDYIMETFPIVKRNDVAAHGAYRTKAQILEVYDAMQEAMDIQQPYRSPLDVHLNRTVEASETKPARRGGPSGQQRETLEGI